MKSQIVFLTTVIGLSVHPSFGEVTWRTGERLPGAMTPAAINQKAAGWRNQQAQGGLGIRHVLVQFDQAVTPDSRNALAAKGVKLLQPLGGNAFFATIDAGRIDATDLAQNHHIAGLCDIQRNWKLHPKLIAGNIPPWAVVSRKADGQAPDRVAAYVLLHPDVNRANVKPGLVSRHNLAVRSEVNLINCLVVELPAAEVGPLADEDSVSWIEPPLPPLGPTNDNNRLLTQAELVQAPPAAPNVYNLDGSGVNVLVYDGNQVDVTHPGLFGRAVIGQGDNSPPAGAYPYDHPTHVAGTIGGNGAGSQTGRDYRGMAPGVDITSYGLPSNLQQGFLYTDPENLESAYTSAITLYGAVIANNSIGTNVAVNGYPCDWEGDYETTDILIDSIVGGSLGAPMRIVWAAGNERGDGRCGTDYHTTAPPANAKNHICVGAVNSNDDSMTSFSSWGPTDDGRLKPDIVAPGCQTNDDDGVTSTVPGGGYAVMCGTSMAAPTVTGLCALLLQDYKAHWPEQPLPRNSTLKMLLAHNAVDRGNPGPDYQFGYGSVRIKDTIDFMRQNSFRELSLASGASPVVLSVIVTSEQITMQVPIKATLAWDDPPGAANTIPELVNDLDLLVIDPQGSRTIPGPSTRTTRPRQRSAPRPIT